MSDTESPMLWLNETSATCKNHIQIMLGNDCVAWTDDRGAELLTVSGKLDIVSATETRPWSEMVELMDELQPEAMVLNAEDFDALVEMLDAPPRDCPELRALMARPTVFDQDA